MNDFEASRETSDPVVVGVVTAPHGVRGTLRVKPLGSGNHIRENVSPLVGGKRRIISKVRETPKGFLVDFEDISSREDADAMRGVELFLDRSELDEPDEDEVYVADLIGLEALDGSGRKLGIVSETFETAAHEILIIKSDDGEIYVPFTMEHVPEVGIEAGKIIVSPPEE